MTLLNNTVFSLEDVGSEQFAEMLIFGAQAACVELHDGGTIADAMDRSLFESPVQSKNPQTWTAEETTAAFSMAIRVMTWGLDLYCPDLNRPS